MIEGLSFARYIQDHRLFPLDPYIQSLAEHRYHERLVYGYLLASFGNLELGALVLHLLCSVSLIAGIFSFSKLFADNKILRWSTVLGSIILGSKFSIGGNELYANYLVPSLVSAAIGIWVFNAVLRNRWNLAFLLLFPVVLIHALMGAQLFLFAVASMFYTVFVVKREPFDHRLIIFSLPALLSLIFIQLYFTVGRVPGFSLSEFLEFRMPHHFLLLAQSFKDLLVSACFLVLGSMLIAFYYKSYVWVPALVLGGVGFYALGQYLGIEIVYQTQWLQSTIWLELLCFSAFFGILNRFLSIKIPTIVFFVFIAFLFLVLNWAGVSSLRNNRYDFLGSWRRDDAVQIALSAKELTPKDALFAVPPDNFSFRYVAERSVYVDFKSIAHHQRFYADWLKRVEILYGLKTGQEGGFQIIAKGLTIYLHRDEESIKKIKQKTGIDYWMTYCDQALAFPILVSNKSFVIYKIP